MDPLTLDNTASVHGLLFIAQKNLARACKPIPPACALPPMQANAREELAADLRRCGKPALR